MFNPCSKTTSAKGLMSGDLEITMNDGSFISCKNNRDVKNKSIKQNSFINIYLKTYVGCPIAFYY